MVRWWLLPFQDFEDYRRRPAGGCCRSRTLRTIAVGLRVAAAVPELRGSSLSARWWSNLSRASRIVAVGLLVAAAVPELRGSSLSACWWLLPFQSFEDDRCRSVGRLTSPGLRGSSLSACWRLLSFQGFEDRRCRPAGGLTFAELRGSTPSVCWSANLSRASRTIAVGPAVVIVTQKSGGPGFIAWTRRGSLN